MALDTRSKRASSVGVGCLWIAAPVFPDGASTQPDRQHGAWSYSGIAAGAGVAGVVAIVRVDLLVASVHRSRVTVVQTHRHVVLL